MHQWSRGLCTALPIRVSAPASRPSSGRRIGGSEWWISWAGSLGGGGNWRGRLALVPALVRCAPGVANVHKPVQGVEPEWRTHRDRHRGKDPTEQVLQKEFPWCGTFLVVAPPLLQRFPIALPSDPNQNGAPIEIATAVRIQPNRCCRRSSHGAEPFWWSPHHSCSAFQSLCHPVNSDNCAFSSAVSA